MTQKSVILLIENDDNDVFFFRRALSHCNFPGQVRVVETAWRARNYLEGVGDFKDRHYYPIPDLIVSDLHLPGATGVEFVEWLRGQPAFAHIPLVLWSGSIPEGELKKALAKGASSYTAKSGDFLQICDRVQEMLKHVKKLPGE